MNIEICEKKYCTGCSSCFNVCPFGAIDMISDGLGFLYPQKNTKCKNCNLCKKVCPVINDIKYKYPMQCYASRVKNNVIEKYNFTSGGVASLLYNYFLSNNNSVIYGVIFDLKKIKCNFIRATKKDEIIKLSGSKYVQAEVGLIYKDVKKDLENNMNVLFIGTPCQVQGLKKFLNKDYQSLLLIDFICHGVPSSKMLQETIDCKKQIKSILFRNKKKYQISVSYIDGTSKFYDSKSCNFIESFLSGNCIRENCHNCKFAKIDRVSDITLGDFWGLSYESSLYNEIDHDDSVSMVLINTKKGNFFFDIIKNDLIYQKRDINEAIDGNSQLRGPVKDTQNSKKFRFLYSNHSFNYSTNKSRSTIDNIKIIIHRLINK